jgi:hypothetical protein
MVYPSKIKSNVKNLNIKGSLSQGNKYNKRRKEGDDFYFRFIDLELILA